MKYGGYANNIAHINLSKGELAYQPIPEDWPRKYIGGRGFGDRYVFENGPHVDPLSAENMICFMNGPLTLTEVNMSGRMAVVTKSPTAIMVAGQLRVCVGLDLMAWSSPAKLINPSMQIFMTKRLNSATPRQFGARVFTKQ